MSFDELSCKKLVARWVWNINASQDCGIFHDESQIPRVFCLFVWNVCYGDDGIINIFWKDLWICLSNSVLQNWHVCLFAHEVSNTPTALSTLWKTRMRYFMSTRKNLAGIAPSTNPLPGREPQRSLRMHTLFQKVPGTPNFFFPNWAAWGCCGSSCLQMLHVVQANVLGCFVYSYCFDWPWECRKVACRLFLLPHRCQF